MRFCDTPFKVGCVGFSVYSEDYAKVSSCLFYIHSYTRCVFTTLQAVKARNNTFCKVIIYVKYFLYFSEYNLEFNFKKCLNSRFVYLFTSVGFGTLGAPCRVNYFKISSAWSILFMCVLCTGCALKHVSFIENVTTCVKELSLCHKPWFPYRFLKP